MQVTRPWRVYADELSDARFSMVWNGVAMAGKFELFTDAADKVRWRLKAGNGEVIAQSQAYASKDAASKGISSVQSNAAGAAVVDLTEAAK